MRPPRPSRIRYCYRFILVYYLITCYNFGVLYKSMLMIHKRFLRYLLSDVMKLGWSTSCLTHQTNVLLTLRTGCAHTFRVPRIQNCSHFINEIKQCVRYPRTKRLFILRRWYQDIGFKQYKNVHDLEASDTLRFICDNKLGKYPSYVLPSCGI